MLSAPSDRLVAPARVLPPVLRCAMTTNTPDDQRRVDVARNRESELTSPGVRPCLERHHQMPVGEAVGAATPIAYFPYKWHNCREKGHKAAQTTSPPGLVSTASTLGRSASTPQRRTILGRSRREQMTLANPCLPGSLADPSTHCPRTTQRRACGAARLPVWLR